MGNYSGKLHLRTFVIDKRNPRKALASIIAIDSDYEYYAEEIVDKYMKMKKYADFDKLLEKVLNPSHKDVEYQYILQHCGYCSAYKTDLIDIDENTVVLALAYNT